MFFLSLILPLPLPNISFPNFILFYFSFVFVFSLSILLPLSPFLSLLPCLSLQFFNFFPFSVSIPLCVAFAFYFSLTV
jgi:hypothetical protein